MLPIVFASLFVACLAVWASGAPAYVVFAVALMAWIAFVYGLYPKVRTYKVAMGVDDRLIAAEATGWHWLGLRLAGLKVLALGFATSMVPFVGQFATWLEGKDLSVFFGPDRGPKMTFYVGAIVFALPFLMSWLHVGAIKDAAETEPKG